MQLQSTGYCQESAPPDPVCLSYTHDRDYGVFKARPCLTSYNTAVEFLTNCGIVAASRRAQEYKTQKMMQNCGRGWCPPRHAEYPDFLAEEPEPLHP